MGDRFGGDSNRAALRGGGRDRVQLKQEPGAAIWTALQYVTETATPCSGDETNPTEQMFGEIIATD